MDAHPFHYVRSFRSATRQYNSHLSSARIELLAQCHYRKQVRTHGETLKNFRLKNAARLWVFATLLAFAGQMAVGAAHSAMIIKEPETVDHVMPDCHGSGDQITQQTVNSTNAQTLESCCEGDCSMMGCQVIYAVLNSTFISHPKISLNLRYDMHSAVPLQRHNSLYRPPILG